MANSELTPKEYRYFKLLRSLFPKGRFWTSKDTKEKNLYKFLKALSKEPARFDDSVEKLSKDFMPIFTSDFLPMWEKMLNLPDECDNVENQTFEQRRRRVLQVLRLRGGQNKDFFKTLAANFGFDIDVIEVEDQPPFRAGQSRAGDRLTNGEWRYAFVVSAPTSSVVRFRAGSRAGEPLLSVTNDTLECLIEKHKPAHSVAIFTFQDEF